MADRARRAAGRRGPARRRAARRRGRPGGCGLRHLPPADRRPATSCSGRPLLIARPDRRAPPSSCGGSPAGGAPDRRSDDRRAARRPPAGPVALAARRSTSSWSAAGSSAAGAALDAATPRPAGRAGRARRHRGRDVVASSRLIHGGLRYLEQYRVRARPRGARRAVAAAPPGAAPRHGSSRCCSRSSAWPVVTRPFYERGMTLYDVLGARDDGGWHRHLSVDEVLEHDARHAPRAACAAAFVFHDGMEDDARYTLAVARTARAEGAPRVTRVAADGLLERGGRVVGVRRSATSSTAPTLEVRARARGRRDRGLGAPIRTVAAVGGGRPPPAEPRRPPRRPPRSDPERRRADDPRPGQGRVPRPVAATSG